MLENLTVLAVIIIVFWLGALAYYFYTSRQQDEIREDLDDLREKLEQLETKAADGGDAKQDIRR